MGLEKQVTSLELSKRLKTLGVEQDSLFWWVDYTSGHSEPAWNLNNNHVGYKDYISAFTVAELGELLPTLYFTRRSGKDEWYCLEEYKTARTPIQGALTEADARAQMLIYLLENNLCKNNK